MLKWKALNLPPINLYSIGAVMPYNSEQDYEVQLSQLSEELYEANKHIEDLKERLIETDEELEATQARYVEIFHINKELEAEVTKLKEVIKYVSRDMPSSYNIF